MLPAAAQTSQRGKYMLFSSPYLEFPGVIINTKNSEDIKSTEQLYDKTVAIVSGYVWEDFFSLHHPQINVIPVNSLTEGLRKVSIGAVDAMIATLPVVIYYIEKEGITNLRVTGETGYYTKLSILTRKDWPLLNSIMDKTLRKIPDKEKKAILQKWISIERKPIFERRIFWIILISIILLSMVLVSVIYTWNVTLKKQVEQKTQELKEDITKRIQVEERLKKSMDAALDTMSRIIEAKDPYTAGHQHRVCQLAVHLARELSLSEDKIEGIRVASLIHDIGKIGLPAEILSKPTKLFDIEFNLIKGHSQIGYDILKSIDFSYPIAQIVLQHHERLNGSGYPNNLKGDKILLEARILGVADVVEAMSSHRPYRPALGIDKALEEISRNKGILYDSKVVGACLKLFKKKGFKFK
jgi:putative nucleotidyltransferase with HDIG domain